MVRPLAQPTSPLEQQVADLAHRLLDGDLGDIYESPTETLFSALVAGLHLYVRSVVADEPHDDQQSLGTIGVDKAMLDDPASFDDVDAARYLGHLRMTLGALEDNLVA
jgi:hypothetical protein